MLVGGDGFLMRKNFFCSLLLCLVGHLGYAHTIMPSVDEFSQSVHSYNLEHPKVSDYERYTPDQYEQIADNLIKYQNNDGGWPKNIDWLAKTSPEGVLSSLILKKRKSTVDNWNVYPQIRYLAHVYTLTDKDEYKDSVLRGLAYLFNTQDEDGAWWGSDVQVPTLNDNVTTGVLKLFLDILDGDERFLWLPMEYRSNIKYAFDNGINFILRAQIIQSGVKTGWAQQYTIGDLQPTRARAYELPAIACWESCNVLNLLMDIKNPNDEIKQAVNSAVKWLNQVTINEFRLEKVYQETSIPEYPYDLIGVKDKDARPIWARFYEISDNTPFMCTRKGNKVYDISELSFERRVGYFWYGYWPDEVFEKYTIWSKQYM